MIKSYDGRLSMMGVLLVALAIGAAQRGVFAQPTTRGSAEAKGQKVMKKVTSKDGTTIAFEQSGSGPVLILVTGALSDRMSHARLATLLAPHFSVINYDRRGRGDSSDTQPYAVQREIEDIGALIDAAGGSASLFGSSSGAALALEAADKLFAKVSKLMLYEPPFVVDGSRPRVPEDFVKHVSELVAANRRGDAVEYFMVDAVGVPREMVAQMRQAPMWPKLEKLAHTIAYDGQVMGDTQSGQPLPADRWKKVTMPALVLSGQRSPPFFHSAADELAKLLPASQRGTLEGADHGVAFTAPQVLAAVLTEFLKDG